MNEIEEPVLLEAQPSRTRRVVLILLVLWLATAVALAIVAWNAYFKQKDTAQTLAEQIQLACDRGTPGEIDGLSPEETRVICNNAQEVIEEDDPELQEGEIQEQEIQESEIQEPEIQDPEDQNRETQDPETQDAETQDAEDQEGEIQEPEIQDEETQDPEIDDPDPNDQINGGSCTFNGTGTITFTWQTSSGPIEVSCTGTGTPPGQQ